MIRVPIVKWLHSIVDRMQPHEPISIYLKKYNAGISYNGLSRTIDIELVFDTELDAFNFVLDHNSHED